MLEGCRWLCADHLARIAFEWRASFVLHKGAVFVTLPGCIAYANVRSTVSYATELAIERAVRALSLETVSSWERS